MSAPETDQARTVKREDSVEGHALRAALHDVLDGADPEAAADRHGLPLAQLREALMRIGSSIKSRRRTVSRAATDRRRLRPEQEARIHGLVCQQLPDALGGTERLWSRDAVRWLIERETGARLPDRTLAAYLERWGFAPEKPMRMQAALQPVRMREWLRRDFPVIAMQAREAEGQVAWLGSAPLQAVHHGKQPKGARRTTVHSPLWESGVLRMLFITSNRGHLRWLVHEGLPTSALLINLLERAIATDERRLFLVAAWEPILASTEFADWIATRRDRVMLELLPFG